MEEGIKANARRDQWLKMVRKRRGGSARAAQGGGDPSENILLYTKKRERRRMRERREGLNHKSKIGMLCRGGPNNFQKATQFVNSQQRRGP